jgi:hypothetical protein
MVPAHLGYFFLIPALFVLQGCGGDAESGDDISAGGSEAGIDRKTGGVCQTACNELHGIFDDEDPNAEPMAQDEYCQHLIKAWESDCTEELWESEDPECIIGRHPDRMDELMMAESYGFAFNTLARGDCGWTAPGE